MEYRIEPVELFKERHYIISYATDSSTWSVVPQTIENPVGEIFESITEAEEAIELLIADFGGEYIGIMHEGELISSEEYTHDEL